MLNGLKFQKLKLYPLLRSLIFRQTSHSPKNLSDAEAETSFFLIQNLVLKRNAFFALNSVTLTIRH